MELTKYIRDIPDYPKPGIIFKDITPLLKDPSAFQRVIAIFKEMFEGAGIQKVCGIESRGFIFGAPMAMALNVGFVPIRKHGKLPGETHSQEYVLEYGSDILEVHTDAIEKGEKVLVVDDLLATGGTAKAVCQLMEKLEAQVAGLAFAIELEFLKGRQILEDYKVSSLIKY